MTNDEYQEYMRREEERATREALLWFKRKFNIADMRNISMAEVGETCRAWIREQSFRLAEPGREWAVRLRERERDGEVLTAMQSRMWREVLGDE